MPFGNWLRMSSHEFEVQRAFDGLRLHEPRPGFHLLAHGARTTARPPLVGEAAAHEGVSAAHDTFLLTRGEHVVEWSEEEPHPAHDLEDLAKLDPQHGYLSVGSAGAFARQDRAGHQQRGDFLRAGLYRVALQQRRLAQVPL